MPVYFGWRVSRPATCLSIFSRRVRKPAAQSGVSQRRACICNTAPSAKNGPSHFERTPRSQGLCCKTVNQRIQRFCDKFEIVSVVIGPLVIYFFSQDLVFRQLCPCFPGSLNSSAPAAKTKCSNRPATVEIHPPWGVTVSTLATDQYNQAKRHRPPRGDKFFSGSTQPVPAERNALPEIAKSCLIVAQDSLDAQFCGAARYSISVMPKNFRK